MQEPDGFRERGTCHCTWSPTQLRHGRGSDSTARTSQASGQVLYLRSLSPEKQVWFSLFYKCENWGERVSEEVGEDDRLPQALPLVGGGGRQSKGESTSLVLFDLVPTSPQGKLFGTAGP